MNDKVILFSCPQMEKVAQEMLSLRNGTKILERGEIDWAHFADGTAKIRFLAPERLKGGDAAFVACFDSMGSAMEQLMTIAQLMDYNPRSLKLFLPYYPTGTMDRWEKPGEVVTAKQLARMFQCLPKKGRVEIIIYDIHALQEEAFFPMDITISLQSAVPTLVDHIASLKDVSIAFPDEGAAKRYRRYFENYPLIYCEKRKSESGEKDIWIREGDPAGRHVYMVDDLILTAGTGINAKHALVKAGASEVSWFAPHGVFPENSWKKVIEAGFSEVWITDSCPKMAERLYGMQPFKIMHLAPIMTDLMSEEFNLIRSR